MKAVLGTNWFLGGRRMRAVGDDEDVTDSRPSRAVVVEAV